MWKYIAKRLLAMIPVLICVTFIVFMIFQFSNGDPARMILGFDATEESIQQLREEMGLNDPAIVQYGRYMLNLLRGDFGTSYITRLPVTAELMTAFPNTIQLALASIVVALLISIPLGRTGGDQAKQLFRHGEHGAGAGRCLAADVLDGLALHSSVLRPYEMAADERRHGASVPSSCRRLRFP